MQLTSDTGDGKKGLLITGSHIPMQESMQQQGQPQQLAQLWFDSRT